jgi:hypothetical protein
MDEFELTKAAILRCLDASESFRARETKGGVVMFVATGDPHLPYVPIALARRLKNAWNVGRLAPDELDERHLWRDEIKFLASRFNFTSTFGLWVIETTGYRTATPHDLFDLARSTETDGPWINLAALRPLSR